MFGGIGVDMYVLGVMAVDVCVSGCVFGVMAVDGLFLGVPVPRGERH